MGFPVQIFTYCDAEVNYSASRLEASALGGLVNLVGGRFEMWNSSGLIKNFDDAGQNDT